MKDKIHIKKSFLQSGKDLQITQSLKVKHPTVQEVLDLDKEGYGFNSESIYYSWVSILVCDPYDYMVYLDDKKLDYEKVEPFDLFIMLYQDTLKKYEEKFKSSLSSEEYENIILNNPYFQAFKFFLNKEYFIIANDENDNLVIGDVDTHTVMIDNETFTYVSEFIKQINGIYEGERINPEDDFAKQILIQDERERLKKLAKKPPDEKENNRLGNLLSAITWASNGGITPFNRNELHMYDLVDGIYRTDKLLNYNHTITGVYSGCVDKDKIDMQKLSWQS